MEQKWNMEEKYYELSSEIQEELSGIKIRIMGVESKLSNHEEEIKEISKWGNLLENRLEKVIETMDKIKNWIIGGISVFIAMEIGVIEMIKLFI